jgi:hypothetical protein
LKKQFVSKCWYDFRLGHSNYTGFLLGVLNSLILTYNFLFSGWFDNIVIYGLLATSVYVPVVTLLGHFHRRYQMKTDMKQQARENPIYDVVLDVQKRLKALEK